MTRVTLLTLVLLVCTLYIYIYISTMAYIQQLRWDDSYYLLCSLLLYTTIAGNKTCHLAMLVARKSLATKVFAFDRSSTRLDLLRRRMKTAGADSIVEACLQSFLDVNVHDPKYKNVTSILLDPSCSVRICDMIYIIYICRIVLASLSILPAPVVAPAHFDDECACIVGIWYVKSLRSCPRMDL
jgi:hypothetical protein